MNHSRGVPRFYPDFTDTYYIMIRITKLDGKQIFLNAEWIQSVESTPDTLITLTTGFTLLVKNSVEEIVDEFKQYQKDIHLTVKERSV